jgi:hypothetical protein
MPELSFDRQDLRHGASLVEVDHEAVDPRTHFRRLKREIQEVRTGNGYKYATEEPRTPEDEPPEPNPRIDGEVVGSQAGRVEGRLVARTNWTQFDSDETEQESLPILAIILGVLGGLIFLGGLAIQGDAQGAALGLGLLFLIGAGAAYYFSDATVRRTEYYYRKRVRVLMEGEVAEETEETPPEVLASDLTVVYSEDFEFDRRGSGGGGDITRADLSASTQERLDSQHTLVTREIEIEDATPEVYCHRGA